MTGQEDQLKNKEIVNNQPNKGKNQKTFC